MKVEVIECVGHSIELIHGETSVCITPDEAENLIAQLRAVVPVPSDVEEAAEMVAKRKYPYEGGTKGAICQLEIPIYREGFKAGAEWQRNKPIPEDVQEAAYQYAKTNRRICSNEVCERLVFCGNLVDAFKAGIAYERERLMKELGKELFTSNPKETNLYKMGAADERERMMEEAVEGQVSAIDTARFIDIDQDICDKRLAECKDGDKVKLIILKEAGK